MFPGLKPGEWEPIKIDTRPKVKDEENKAAALTNGSSATASVAVNGGTKPADAPAPPAAADVDMADAPAQAEVAEKPLAENGALPPTTEPTETKPVDDQPGPAETEPEVEYEDDPYSEEGAVHPIVEGRIENWSCFFALLSHIWKTMGPHFVSPLLVISQPCWTERDKEMVTQYFFENHRIPAFCMMDAALAACYAYGIPTGLVVDVGLDKCDVSAVTEYQVNDSGRAVALEGCGGRSMTKRLQHALNAKGIECDEAMAEALKKSSICEILPAGTDLPVGGAVPNGHVPNPAAAASTGAVDSGPNAKEADGTQPGSAPRGPGNGTETGEENGEDENEGVLDVASIVAQSNAAEILAKREAEKAAKLAAKKGAQAEAPRPVRLRNAEREKTTFTYEELLPSDATGSDGSRKRKREVEVGVERFMAAYPPDGETDGILDKISAAVHSTVLGVADIPQRSHLWDNMIILGNGTRVRGKSSSTHSLTTTDHV
jgi:actin-related protein 9